MFKILALLLVLSFIPAFAVSGPRKYAVDTASIALAAAAASSTVQAAPVKAGRAASPPDPYETCVAHGGVAELFWGLSLEQGQTATRWCPKGHLSQILWLQPWFVLALLKRVQ